MHHRQEMTLSKQKDSLSPILCLCVLRRIMQKTRTKSNLCFSHSDGGGDRRRFLPSLFSQVSQCQVVPQHRRSSWGGCYPQQARRNHLGRIIPARHFSFNLGFQPWLEKLITSKMQKYGVEEGKVLYDLFFISKKGGADNKTPYK